MPVGCSGPRWQARQARHKPSLSEGRVAIAEFFFFFGGVFLEAFLTIC